MLLGGILFYKVMQKEQPLENRTPLHPTFPEQQEVVNTLLSKLTFESVYSYLRSKFGLTLTQFTPISTNGVINFTFILTFQGHHLLAPNQKFFFRMGNPHKFWRKVKTENEVSVLRLVSQRTQLPVPRVVDFCSNFEESPLGCEFILMTFVESDMDLEQWIRRIQKRYQSGEISREDCLNIFKGFLKEIYYYVDQLFSLNVDGNKYICGFDINLNPVAINWDGPCIGPSPTLLDFLVNSLRHSLFNYADRMSTQTDPETKSLYVLLHGPLQSVLADLESSASPPPSSFVFRHGDLHAGNINVSGNRIVGIFDWEHSRMDVMFRDWEDLDIADMWYSDLQDKEILRQLAQYEKQLTEHMNQKYAKKEWDSYKLVWRILYEACDTWFYVANWWAKSDQTDWRQLVRAEAKNGLQSLKKLLTEAKYL